MEHDLTTESLAPDATLETFEVIRTETALSRYPLHNLSTSGPIKIDIRKKDEGGATKLLWQVGYDNRYGQPGRLAYKLDTLVINRAIEEARKPIPKIIKLGSLRQIAKELDLGGSTTQLKTAFLQNVFTGITARITYKATDKTEKTIEAAFTRYSIIFTGETLPDGHKADSVYLVLNDIYMEILNNALTRPLDYDYIHDLSPSEQRFYELVSYQIYPAVKYNQRARLLYSEYCLYSPATRYFTYEQVKKQMYKIHRPHLKARYIAKVEFEATVDEQGRPDWVMWYTPGEKARHEQIVFSFVGMIPRKPRETARRRAGATQKPRQTENRTAQEELPFFSEVPRPLRAEELVRFFYEKFHGTGKTIRPTTKELGQAQDLLVRVGYEQAWFLVGFAQEEANKTKFDIQTFGGILQYEPKACKLFEASAAETRRAEREKARHEHEKRFRSSYLSFLGEYIRGEFQTKHPETYSGFLAYEDGLRQFCQARATKSERSATFYRDFDKDEQRVPRLLDFVAKNPTVGVPSFWDWDKAYNPEPYE